MKAAAIVQFVMSCRVIGLGVEARALETVSETLQAQGAAEILGRIVPTGKNALALDLFAKAGFTDRDGTWVRRLD